MNSRSVAFLIFLVLAYVVLGLAWLAVANSTSALKSRDTWKTGLTVLAVAVFLGSALMSARQSRFRSSRETIAVSAGAIALGVTLLVALSYVADLGMFHDGAWWRPITFICAPTVLGAMLSGAISLSVRKWSRG